MAKGLGFEALVASPDEKRVAREKLLGRNLLPYLNKTDKKSVDENYLKMRSIQVKFLLLLLQMKKSLLD